jgi:UDP-glucuronate 4-epimerase
LTSDAPSSLAGKRILVTGAAGFIGYHVAARLLGAGAKVLGLDNLNTYYDVSLKQGRLKRLGANPEFTFSELDLAQHDMVLALFAEFQPDMVVHLAAQAGVRHSLSAPRAFTSANVDGFLGILEACRAHPVAHLVYASSSSVYGSGTTPPFREASQADQPVSLYAATKRANELMAYSYAHLFGIPASGLRFFTVYGPWGRPDMAYYSFTRAISEGLPIDVYNHGRMRRDFTYIDDVTEAIAKLLPIAPAKAMMSLGADATDTVPHLIYNVGNNAPIELGRFINVIEAAVGRQAELRYLPMQPGDVIETSADVSRLTAVTGYRPSTSIETGIGRFVAWYREHGARG